MYTSMVEFLALVLLIGGSWHASRTEGRSFAQQWFVPGYLAALTREIINQVVFRVYVFAPDALRLGSAPVLITLLGVGVGYLAYAFAKRLVDPSRAVWMTGLIFLIAASFALPIEATAAQLRWWLFTTQTPTLFSGVPLTAPLAWGISAAIFYAAFWRIRQTRLNEPGKFYALVVASPIIAVGQMLFTILLGA